MYCVNCGFQLPDNANFCSKCGMPQNPEEKADEQIWETCEITWDEGSDPRWLISPPPDSYDYNQCCGRFCARAMGSEREYIIAATSDAFFSAYRNESHQYEHFPAERNEKNFHVSQYLGRYGYGNKGSAGTFLQKFINQLVASGWEQTDTRGDKWYSYRFRRRVK